MEQSQVKEKLAEFIFAKKERQFDPQITFKQLMVKKTIVWCWGATEFTGYKEDALVFKVRGYKHKGYVVITLGFIDTYNIHLLSFKGEQVGETITDIYCDRLTDAIDSLVETV